MENCGSFRPDVTLITFLLRLVTGTSHMALLSSEGWGLLTLLCWTKFSGKADPVGCILIVKRDLYRVVYILGAREVVYTLERRGAQ